MTILKALKNFIAKSGGTTKAGTIAEAINDMPVGGGGGYKKYELKGSSGTSGAFRYIDGLTLEAFKEIFKNKDQIMTINDPDNEGLSAQFSWMVAAYCDDQESTYALIVGDSSVSDEFDYDPEDGLFKNTAK